MVTTARRGSTMVWTVRLQRTVAHEIKAKKKKKAWKDFWMKGSKSFTGVGAGAGGTTKTHNIRTIIFHVILETSIFCYNKRVMMSSRETIN